MNKYVVRNINILLRCLVAAILSICCLLSTKVDVLAKENGMLEEENKSTELSDLDNLLQEMEIGFEHLSEKDYVDNLLNNAEDVNVVKSEDGQYVAISFTKVLSEYSKNGKKYKDKEAYLMLLMAGLRGNDTSTSVSAYGIQGFTTLNYSIQQTGIGVFDIQFNTLSVRYVNLPTVSTYVSTIIGAVDFTRIVGIPDYYANHQINNPTAGVTYTKYLNSGWITNNSDVLSIGIHMDFTNGNSADYTKVVFSP